MGGELAELFVDVVPSRNAAVGQHFRDGTRPEVSQSLPGISGSPPTNRVGGDSKELQEKGVLKKIALNGESLKVVARKEET